MAIINTGAVERTITGKHDANFVHPLGDELVLNGSFETDSDWTKGTGWSVIGGKANAVNASNQSLSQSTSSVLLNKKYIISFDAEHISGTAKFQLVGGTTQDVVTVTSSGSYVAEVVSNANKSSYRFKGLTTGDGFNGSIDNVSVKEVLVNRESTVTNTGVVERDIEGKHDANFVHPLGDELILNTQFDTSSDWILGTGWNIENNKAVAVLADNTPMQQNQTTVANKIYKVVYTISDYQNGEVRFQFSGNGGNTIGITRTANGTYTEYITSTLNHTLYRFKATSADGGFSGSIDNISVKEMLVNRESTVTNTGAVEREIEASHDANFVHPLGDELVLNGNFSDDGSWDKPASWTISGGTANCDGSQSGNSNLTQGNVISDQSKIYRVEFTLSNYAAGSVKSKISNGALGKNRAANGTYVDILSGMVNNTLSLTASGNFVGSIDNVSVKEVLVNRESTVTNTGVVERDIEGKHDANFVRPLGDELITNGDFSTNTDWNLATGLTIDSSKLVGNSIFGDAAQNINSTNGETYKVIFTISDYVKGKVRFQLRGGVTVNGTARNANGVYTQYIVAAANHTDFILRGLADSGGFTGNIDNVSVKEVLVNRESTVTNTGAVERGVTGINESDTF